MIVSLIPFRRLHMFILVKFTMFVFYRWYFASLLRNICWIYILHYSINFVILPLLTLSWIFMFATSIKLRILLSFSIPSIPVSIFEMITLLHVNITDFILVNPLHTAIVIDIILDFGIVVCVGDARVIDIIAWDRVRVGVVGGVNCTIFDDGGHYFVVRVRVGGWGGFDCYFYNFAFDVLEVAFLFVNIPSVKVKSCNRSFVIREWNLNIKFISHVF